MSEQYLDTRRSVIQFMLKETLGSQCIWFISNQYFGIIMYILDDAFLFYLKFLYTFTWFSSVVAMLLRFKSVAALAISTKELFSFWNINAWIWHTLILVFSTQISKGPALEMVLKSALNFKSPVECLCDYRWLNVDNEYLTPI